MLSAPPFNWSRRRYSYAVVVGMTVLGLAFPHQSVWLLGVPLALGMVVLGIAHGACDQFVVPASQPSAPGRMGYRYWVRFLVSYLGLAGVVGVLWWQWPAATVGIFFLLTVWHWGSADAPSGPQVAPEWWLAHSLLRGLLLFAVPTWCWPTETAGIVNGLLAFVGARTIAPATFAQAAVVLGSIVAVGHLALWLRYSLRRQYGLLRLDLLELLMLIGLFVALPPKLSVAVYFVFWHSLQHVLRLNGWLGYASAGHRSVTWTDLLAQMKFFLRRAAPILFVSCVALLLLGRLLAAQLTDAGAWFSLALVVASVVTLPHALLVTLVMDAPQWHKLPIGKSWHLARPTLRNWSLRKHQ